MPKPHPQASPFHQPHYTDAERKLPVGMLPGSLDYPISTTSCYIAWHPLEGFRAWGNIRVTAARSTHAHPKIAAITVVDCTSGRAGQALPESPRCPRTVSGRQCRWKKRAHQAPLHASTAVPSPGLGDFLMVGGSEKDTELQPLPLNH